MHSPIRTLSIIIPAYNEERTIHLILDKVRDAQLHHGIAKEVIIVNDGSTDGTARATQQYMVANPGLGIRFIEFRSAWGVNVLDLDDEQVARARDILSAHGIQASSIG